MSTRAVKLIIAGSRDIKVAFDLISVSVAVLEFVHNVEVVEVVSGMARGIDTAGLNWAVLQGISVKRMPADWNRLGKGAGYFRNQEMADYADALLAFRVAPPVKSKGTDDMISKAKSRGLIISVVHIISTQ